MPDREKVIKGLSNHVYGHPHTRCHKCPYWGTGAHGSSECTVLFADALALLKEQEAEISKISKAYLDLVGKASRQPQIIRCKDCKFYPDGEGSTGWLPCRNIITPPGWYCADGVRKDADRSENQPDE